MKERDLYKLRSDLPVSSCNSLLVKWYYAIIVFSFFLYLSLSYFGVVSLRCQYFLQPYQTGRTQFKNSFVLTMFCWLKEETITFVSVFRNIALKNRMLFFIFCSSKKKKKHPFETKYNMCQCWLSWIGWVF